MFSHKDLGEVGVDAPVVRFVGVGESGSRDFAAEAHVIELRLHRPQAGLDVAKTLAKGQLGESQTQELIETGKGTQFVIAAITRDALVELVGRKVIHQLGEDEAADVHATLSMVSEIRPEGSRKRGWKFKSTKLRGAPSVLN